MTLSDFTIIVVCISGSMKELHNNSDVQDVLFFSTLGLLAGTDPTCQVKFCSLPEILLYHTASFLCPSSGVLNY